RKRLPRILKRDLVETVCGVGKKLLVEARYECQQGHRKLGKIASVVRSHELRQIADLHFERSRLDLFPHLLAARRVFAKHLRSIVVALRGFWRDILKPLFRPRFIHILNTLVRGRWFPEAWILRRREELDRHHRHVDHTTQYFGVLDSEFISDQ